MTEGHAPLGLVGLWFPEGWHEPEIGWILFEGAEGRGIAREAAEAARAHAYGTLGWTTAVSVIHPGNARSIALADRHRRPARGRLRAPRGRLRCAYGAIRDPTPSQGPTPSQSAMPSQGTMPPQPPGRGRRHERPTTPSARR